MKKRLHNAGRIALAAAATVLVFAVVAPDANGQSGRSRSSERTERASKGRTSTTRSASKTKESSKASRQTPAAKQRGAATSRTTGQKNTSGAAARSRSGSGRAATRGSARQETAKKGGLEKANNGSASGRSSAGSGSRSGSASGAASRGSASRSSGATDKRTASRSSGATGSRATSRSGASTSKAGGGRTVTRAGSGGRVDSGRDVRNRRDRTDAVADRTRTGSRAIRNDVRNYRQPRVLPTFRNHYGRAHRADYAWCNQHHHPGHYHYAHARVHVSSHIHIGVRWPWQIRLKARWQPRYRYRQVIYVDAGWGGRHYSQRVDVRTSYRQRILEATDEFAVIEIDIDSIELYQGGRYLGFVDRIPNRLGRMRATVYSDGYIEFDRNVFLVGDMHRGFELLSTPHYDDYVLNAYRSEHDVRAGRVDLRRERVKSIRRSRLFNPHSFNGLVPISLLPDDDRLWDYGRDVISDNYGGYGYDRGNYGDDWRYELGRNDEIRYNTESGVAVQYNRETMLERID